MDAPSATRLLELWERGAAWNSTGWALGLLAAACPETSAEALSQLSVGQRNARLLRLRALLFGSRLRSLADCPGCGQRVEWAVETGELAPAREAEPPAELELSVGGYEVRFRLPNSGDLAELEEEREAGVAAARERLLGNCVMKARHNGQETLPAGLPSEVAQAVADRMEEADPQADLRLGLVCPACGHRWQATLDIVTFLWTEINAWAVRLLREVHALALAYGWTEADVLALSPGRRQAYLEMIGG